MNISYPAICHSENGTYWCEFPDLPGCFSQGESEQEIISNAREALELHIEYFLEKGEALPAVTPITALHASDGFVTYISCNIPQGEKSVKKTLTIPSWLNARAEKAAINFSQTLQEALCKKLNVTPA